jgi:hypothetical protein
MGVIPGNTNPSARQRAERELVTDPRRSDHVIAIAAHCTPQPVGRWRREPADAGQIPRIEPSQRTQRIGTWPAASRPASLPKRRAGSRHC